MTKYHSLVNQAIFDAVMVILYRLVQVNNFKKYRALAVKKTSCFGTSVFGK